MLAEGSFGHCLCPIGAGPEDRREVAAVTCLDGARRGDNLQRASWVPQREDTCLTRQRRRQQRRVSERPEALDRLAVVPGGTRLVAHALADDPEVGVGVALAPPVAFGGVDGQCSIDQLTGLREVAFDDACQTEYRGGARFADPVTRVAVDATRFLEAGTSLLDPQGRHGGQTLEEDGPPSKCILSDLRSQLDRLGQHSLRGIDLGLHEPQHPGGDQRHGPEPITCGAASEQDVRQPPSVGVAEHREQVAGRGQQAQAAAGIVHRRPIERGSYVAVVVLQLGDDPLSAGRWPAQSRLAHRREMAQVSGPGLVCLARLDEELLGELTDRL